MVLQPLVTAGWLGVQLCALGSEGWFLSLGASVSPCTQQGVEQSELLDLFHVPTPL